MIAKTCAWVPVDDLASIILELSGITPGIYPTRLKDPFRFYNLVNPTTFAWDEELLPALRSAGLEFETVSKKEWIEALQRSDPDPERNPSVKLLSFYEKKYLNEEADYLEFSTEKAREDSATMRELPHLIRDGYVEKFLSSWMEKWVFME